MNRAVSTWKKLFFKSNISKIRKAIMDYLEEEGIKVKLENGSLVVKIAENGAYPPNQNGLIHPQLSLKWA